MAKIKIMKILCSVFFTFTKYYPIKILYPVSSSACDGGGNRALYPSIFLLIMCARTLYPSTFPLIMCGQNLVPKYFSSYHVCQSLVPKYFPSYHVCSEPCTQVFSSYHVCQSLVPKYFPSYHVCPEPCTQVFFLSCVPGHMKSPLYLQVLND